MPARPTFAQLMELDERLAELQRDVRSEYMTWSWCKVAAWARYKVALRQIVGPDRPGPPHPVLSQESALAVASSHLWALLPEGCGRGTGCGCRTA